MFNLDNKLLAKIENSIRLDSKLNFILKLSKCLCNQQKKIFLDHWKYIKNYG